jgi:hypothetical protein
MTMTTRSALALLRHHLRALQDVLRGLALALDDVPDAQNEPAIVDAMRSTASEIESQLETALAAEGPETSVALHCQAALHQMQISTRELASHANVLELSRLAAERGGAWRRWTEAVREALDACEEALHTAAAAMLALWRELVESRAVPAVQG